MTIFYKVWADEDGTVRMTPEPKIETYGAPAKDRVIWCEGMIRALTYRIVALEKQLGGRPKWSRGPDVFCVCSACGETYTADEFRDLDKTLPTVASMRDLDHRRCRACGSVNAQ